MMQQDHKPQSVFKSKNVLISYITVLVLLIIFSSIAFYDAKIFGLKSLATDFNAFNDAGNISLRTNASDAYNIRNMLAEQIKYSDEIVFMPWTYPPPYMLLTLLIACMHISVAYFIFISISLSIYAFLIRKISHEYTTGVLIALLPSIILNIRTGQNGFITGSLIGLFVIFFAKRKIISGIPLGLMIIKPHLAVGISLASLVGRRWGAMLIAAIIVITSFVISTMVFGPQIWPSFLESVKDSSNFLAAAYYPLERMTSIYATMRVATGSATLAMIVHMIGASLAVGAIIWAWARKLQPAYLLATICVASMYISPYNYDYDLLITGVALALVIKDFVALSRPIERGLLVAFMWLAGGTGYALQIMFALSEIESDIPSIGSLALLLAVALTIRVLRRETSLHSGSRSRLETVLKKRIKSA